MIVIVTEDTKTGYDFMCLLNKLIFQTPVKIFNTAYKDPNGAGSNSKLFQVILKLIENQEINKGDTVFILFDSIIPLPTKPRMAKDQRALEGNIKKAKIKLRKMGVQCYTSTHTCIEEVFISFGELIEFSSLPDREMSDPKIKLCKTIQSLIEHGNKIPKVDYKAIFSSEIRAEKTIENCLKDLLK